MNSGSILLHSTIRSLLGSGVRVPLLPQKNFKIMKKTVKFFKQDDKWYADIPNHTLDENEMVLGSDIVLEMFANGAKELNITLSDDDTSNSFLTLKREEHDSEGAWYSFDGLWYTSIMNVLDRDRKSVV